MRMLSRLFADRTMAILKLREKIISLKLSHAIISKRMAYLESRHPDIYQHLTNKERPVARLRANEKEKIMQDVDAWLEGLK